MTTSLALPRRTFFTALLAGVACVALALAATPTPASACGADGDAQGAAHHCPFALDGLQATAEDLTNGAQLTLTSDNDDEVELIQEWAERRAEGQGCQHHGMEGVEISSETLPNGARVTFSSDDSETVAHLQEMARRKATGESCGLDENDHEGACGHHCSGEHCTGEHCSGHHDEE